MIRSGDTIRDTQGTAWQLGQSLGRGLWGKSFIVRREFDDALFVLKAPLGAEDFRGEFPFADLVISASRAAILEQARLYGEAGHNFLPRLEARAALSGETTGYILPHFPATLESRIAEGASLADIVDLLLQVAKFARQLPAGFHGNLRARNILLAEGGGVFLTDVATNAVPRAVTRMIAAAPAHGAAFPPEISEASGDVTLNPGCDSWAIAMMLWEGVLAGEPLPNAPRQGLDKSASQVVRDRVMDRMKNEDSNPRFHARLAERVAILTSRALSREHTPSPPFRFPKSEDLHARLEDLLQLIRPQVQSVGKVMLDRTASKPWFTTDESVAFTCLAGASAGVEGNEEIGVGIAVFDALSNERLKDLQLGYTSDRNPSGRYRFAFKIEGLYPGNFKARLAFAIRDSGQPPATAEVDFLVRPAPGWVPPEEAVPPRSLPFEREQAPAPRAAEVAVSAAPQVQAPVHAPVQAQVQVQPQPQAERPSLTMPAPPVRIAAPLPASQTTNQPAPIRPSAMPTVATARAAPATAGPSVDTVVSYPRLIPLAESAPDEGDRPPPIRMPAEHTGTRPLITTNGATNGTTNVVPESTPEEYVPVRLRQGWNQDPLGASVRDLEDDDDQGDDLPPGEPSMLENAWLQAKNDPYVLVVGGLSIVAFLLILAVFAFR